jgi:hypothetical protein
MNSGLDNERMAPCRVCEFSVDQPDSDDTLRRVA